MNTAWGFDCGSDSLKFVQVKEDEGQVQTVAHGCYQYGATGVFEEFPEEHLGSALRRFLADYSIDRKDTVVISVPGRLVLSRFTRLPPVAEHRYADIIAYEADQQIPFDLEEMSWYWHARKAADMPDINASILAIKKDLVEAQLEVFEKAGFAAIHAVQSDAVALYNALESLGLFGKRAVVLDIGWNSTELIIAGSDDFWIRTIPIGGEGFVKCISKSFKLSAAKAKKLLETVAESKYATQLLQSLKPVFADLLQEVQRSVGFWQSTHRNEIDNLYVTGGVSQVPGLKEYLATNLGIHPVTKLCMQADQPGVLESNPVFWPAYGLALQGLGKAEVKGNFIPQSKSLAAALSAAKNYLSKPRLPAFVSQFTMVELLVVVGIVALVIALVLPLFQYTERQHARGGAATTAVIRIQTSADGSISIFSEFNPPFNEADSQANSNGHRLAKKIVAEHGFFSREN